MEPVDGHVSDDVHPHGNPDLCDNSDNLNNASVDPEDALDPFDYQGQMYAGISVTVVDSDVDPTEDEMITAPASSAASDTNLDVLAIQDDNHSSRTSDSGLELGTSVGADHEIPHSQSDNEDFDEWASVLDEEPIEIEVEIADGDSDHSTFDPSECSSLDSLSDISNADSESECDSTIAEPPTIETIEDDSPVTCTSHQEQSAKRFKCG